MSAKDLLNKQKTSLIVSTEKNIALLKGRWINSTRQFRQSTCQRAQLNSPWLLPGRTLSLARAATSVICVATNTCLSRQKYACRDKSFVVTKLFVVTKHVFCRHKSMLAATKVLSPQNFCPDKHTFVTTKDVLSRQKVYLWQPPTSNSLSYQQQEYDKDDEFWDEKQKKMWNRMTASVLKQDPKRFKRFLMTSSNENVHTVCPC